MAVGQSQAFRLWLELAKSFQLSLTARDRVTATTITTANDPLILSPPCSGPASHHHVGSISTAYGALGWRCGSQCCQQNSFGTTPGCPSHPTAPASFNNSICGIVASLGGSLDSIELMADALGDTALGLDV